MASLADMTVTLGLDDKDFTRGINNAEKNVEKFGKTSEKEISNTAKLFDTLKTALAGIAVGSLVTQIAQLNTDIVNTAKALNISTEAAIAFQKATAAAGGDADNARDALISLTQKLGEAASSGGDALAAFNEMGLGLADINKNSPEQMLLKTLKAMDALSDSTQRESIRTRIFGEDFKNANLPEVIRNMEALSSKARELAPSYVAARNAQLQFNQTYANFQDEVTKNIPWDSLSASLKSISDNLETIVGVTKGVLEIGAAFLFVSKIMVPLREAVASVGESVSMFGGAMSWLGTHAKGTLLPLLESFKDIGAVIFGTGPLLARFGTSLVGIFGLGGKVAVLYAIADGLNEIIKSITGFDAFDTLDTLTQKLAQLFNIPYQTEYHKKVRETALKQAEEEAKIEEEKKKHINDSNDSRGKTSKLLDDQSKTLAQIHSQYRQQNEQALAKLELDNSLIGASEQQKRVQSELMNIENQRQQVVQGLYDKIYEATDPALMEQYTAAIEKTNDAFAKQKEEVATLMLNAQEQEMMVRLKNVADQKHIENQQTLRDLSNEQANVFMPALAQQYRNIEQAADDAYKAMLETEKVNWAWQSVENIPQSVKDSLKKAAYENVQAEKDKRKEIEETNNAKKYSEFLSQTELDNAREVRRINNDLALSVMPAYQQISAKLTNDARERAQSTIDEINATRGYKMSATEAQAYYDAAAAGLDKVIAKQQESYLISRKWSTGWNNAMNEYIENATNAAKIAENVFSKAMQGMEDMFIDFVKTGKFEWKDFVNSMLEELLRAQFRQTIASIFTGGGQGAKTGSSSGGVLSNLFSGFFAEGGNIPAGNWGIVGEKGPEIITGPANITPMNKLASESTNVTYHINAVDALSFKQMIAADPTFLYAVSEQGRRRLPGGR